MYIFLVQNTGFHKETVFVAPYSKDNIAHTQKETNSQTD